MNGDAENDLEGGGDAPAPVDPPASEGGDPAFRRKAFSNWGAAKREEPSPPSLLRRASQRLKGLFSSKKEGEPAADGELELQEDIELSGAVQDIPLLDVPADEPEPELTSQAGDEPAWIGEPATDGPKEDLKFLWTASEETAADPIDVAGLDAALPMDEPPADTPVPLLDEMPLADEPPPSPAKKGFFSRLLGRARKREIEATVDAPDLGTADVIPDPAGQLDAADKGFASAEESFAPPAQASADAGFGSVDDALPLETAASVDVPTAFDETQAIDVSQPPESTPVGAETGASYHAMPVYDFDKPKVDDRSTMEVDLPAAEPIDARPTFEVQASDVSAIDVPAIDVPVAAHTDEVERDTDEFEAVDLSETIAEDPDKTGAVPRGPGFFKKLFSRTKEVTMVEAAVPPPPTANPTFLVTKFRTFYNEVVVYKNQKAEFTAGFATAIVTDYTADLSPEQSSQSLSQRLHQMLELQLAESSWMGGEAHDLYPEAQYAMAVLADEMLTHMEWPGQAAWGAHHLELKLFKSAAADVEFFKRVDKLLKNGVQTVGTRDLARVYLLAIASGFRGKYRPFDLHRPLAEYRRRLYEFVYDGDALLLYADDRRIFPEATSATVVGKGVKRFSMAQQWAAILIILLAGYTVISHLAWNRVSADLQDIAGRVEQARTSTTNGADTPNGGGAR